MSIRPSDHFPDPLSYSSVEFPLTKDLVNQFEHSPQIPISSFLPLPEQKIDMSKAKEQIRSTTQITLDVTTTPSEKKETLGRVQSRGLALVNFAKSHPFLTGGFILGVIFLLCSFPSIASAFAQKTGFTLFHSQLTIGLGVGLVTLYYGVYLINLARRAAIKDELELRIQAQNKMKETILRGGGKEEITELVQDIERAVKGITESSSKTILMLKKHHQDLVEELTKKDAGKKILEKNIHTLQGLIQSEVFKNLPSELSTFKTSSMELLKRGREVLLLGEKILLAEWEVANTDPVFNLPPLPDLLILPEEATPMQLENQKIKQSIIEKLGDFFVSAFSFIKENPTSAVIMGAGIIFTLIAIPALTYWFSGHQSIYFLGSLSLIGGFQFIIYGISLIYEGHNSAVIEKLKKSLEEVENELYERQEILEKMKQDKLKLQNEAFKSLQHFQTQWQRSIETLEASFLSELKFVQAPIQERAKLVSECQQRIQEIIEKTFSIPFQLLPDSAAQKKVFEEPLFGAETVIQNL